MFFHTLIATILREIPDAEISIQQRPVLHSSNYNITVRGHNRIVSYVITSHEITMPANELFAESLAHQLVDSLAPQPTMQYQRPSYVQEIYGHHWVSSHGARDRETEEYEGIYKRGKSE